MTTGSRGIGDSDYPDEIAGEKAEKLRAILDSTPYDSIPTTDRVGLAGRKAYKAAVAVNDPRIAPEERDPAAIRKAEAAQQIANELASNANLKLI